MSNRVERLRIYLLGSAIFLLLVIGVFIGVARYLRRHSMALFPVQMALDIVRDAEGWDYCPSDGSTKKFCIHAAKAVEYKNGQMILHDASITLYGAKGDRSDRIYGDEFEYDRSAQIVRAPGVVHIDLQAAGKAVGAAAGPAGGSAQPAATTKVIHVTTSGLVYLQKLGLAATSEPVVFESAGLTGHAVGADYSSDTALVTLHSAVSINGMLDGHAVAMTAATAAFDDQSQQALLTHATVDSEGRKAAAEQATLYRRPDGTLSRIVAKGDVTAEAKGSTVVADRADVEMTAESRPQTITLAGGVKYSMGQPLRQISGMADSATIHFDADRKPQPQHATFVGAVLMTERTRATLAAGEPWSTRELKAAQVDVALDRQADKAVPRDIVATGNPHITVVNRGSLARTAGAGTAELSADTLSAHLTQTSDPKAAPQVETIAGRGSTRLRQISVDGKEQTVAADSLDAKLRPRPARGDAKAGAVPEEKLADSLLSAVQVGHVQLMQHLPAKPGVDATGKGGHQDEVQHALADRAVYDGDADRMTLSGGVQLSDPDSVLWANQVALDNKTQDAHATGGVKVSYTAEAARPGSHGPVEPTHVVADRADLEHATGTSTFYGKPVRLWQGGNQILAPVIELSNPQKRLVARGDGTVGTNGTQVRTVLAGSAGAKQSTASGTDACSVSTTAKAGLGPAATQNTSAVVVTSGSLTVTYSGNTGQADFTGGFRADTPDGTTRAAEGVVYLRQDPAKQSGVPSPTTPTASLSWQLDHIVAAGRVESNNAGLKATGERLVYTVSDRTAVLTGDGKTLPKAVGPQGTTTGTELVMHSSCDGKGGVSVEVRGSPGQPAHTDARVSEETTKEKGKR